LAETCTYQIKEEAWSSNSPTEELYQRSPETFEAFDTIATLRTQS
jgi:hypothetical protein